MKMSKILLSSAAVLGMVAASSSVSAATKADGVDGSKGGVYHSTGSVSFKDDDSQTDPVDPTDPTDPVTPVDPTDPTKPVHPGTAGPLSIDFASSLAFGEQIISGDNQVYKAKVQSVTDKDGTRDVPNYVQVTDKRGTNAGWTLTVNEGAQFASNGEKLTGAELAIAAGKQTVAGKNAVDPTVDPTATQTAQVIGTDASTVMGAKADQGMGTWTDAFGKDAADAADAVTLTVPGTSKKNAGDTYTTDLVWTLTNDVFAG
ncbi:WxL domain-containing protein [Dellaglioa sp. BT-FLS60]